MFPSNVFFSSNATNSRNTSLDLALKEKRTQNETYLDPGPSTTSISSLEAFNSLSGLSGVPRMPLDQPPFVFVNDLRAGQPEEQGNLENTTKRRPGRPKGSRNKKEKTDTDGRRPPGRPRGTGYKQKAMAEARASGGAPIDLPMKRPVGRPPKEITSRFTAKSSHGISQYSVPEHGLVSSVEFLSHRISFSCHNVVRTFIS